MAISDNSVTCALTPYNIYKALNCGQRIKNNIETIHLIYDVGVRTLAQVGHKVRVLRRCVAFGTAPTSPAIPEGSSRGRFIREMLEFEEIICVQLCHHLSSEEFLAYT